MPFDLSKLINLTIPVASLGFGAWLYSQDKNYYGGVIIFIGLIWWGIDQFIRWEKFRHSDSYRRA